MAPTIEDVRRAAGPQCGWARWPLVALCAWWTLRLGSGSGSWCFLNYVDLVFHEAGHPIFSVLGETMMFLGGTLGQLLVPALLCGYFLAKDGARFAAAFCAWWFGENFTYIARYMADARDLALPLVGGGDEHDWNHLFYRFGLLGEASVARVSWLTHAFGVAVMLAALAWMILLGLPDGARERWAGRLPFLRPLLG